MTKKVNSEILNDLSISKEKNPALDGKSKFQGMLDQHLKIARGEVPAGPQNTIPNDPFEEEIFEMFAHLETLKEKDPDFGKKLEKKKTLADNFTNRFGAKTVERFEKFKNLIITKADKYGIDRDVLAGLIRQESNYNPYAVSHCGAMGLGQLMPETARHLGVKDPFNAAQNLDGAAKYLKEMLNTFGGNLDKALAAYNAGPGAVKKYGGIPPYSETQNYVRSIKSHVNTIRSQNMFAEKTETKKEKVG